MLLRFAARGQCAARTQLTRSVHQHTHVRPVAISNSPFRVPQPVYDNTVIKRRAFKGKTLQLVQLDNNHAPDLWVASGKGSAIIGEFLPGKFPSTPLQFNYYIRDLALVNDDPFSRGVNFCIKNTVDNDVPIGIITLRNISALNKSLEVGFTWIDQELWGTHINLEAHYILLEEVFEFLRFNRVGFTVDSSDARFGHFLEGIGATREGTMRSFQIGNDEKPRDAVLYSIIESEWPAIKAKIRGKISQKLHTQIEKAKAKLSKEGLLEAYEKEREKKVQSKKVVKVAKETDDQDFEESREMKKMFEEEDAANEQFASEMENTGKGKIVQRKRPPLKRKGKK